ncbi:MAG: winged helix-turn-helix domain-containing protein [Lachnospiraceae bacterium]|nr:winged helix-turn-helix domain-containing protein [Lachnospiraceae bacterium]
MIGRLLLMEFGEKDSVIFDEVMAVLKRHPDFEKLQLSEEMIISIPGLEIYPEQRKIYRDRQEIHLTAKEYDLLCLLVYNQGRVLTYEQIYQRVWGEEPLGNENNAVGCHVRNLREKLFQISSDPTFNIRCVREIGYCLEIE